MRTKQYDLAGLNIRCNADKIGTKVFNFKSPDGIRIKVLAYDKEHAIVSLNNTPFEQMPNWFKRDNLDPSDFKYIP